MHLRTAGHRRGKTRKHQKRTEGFVRCSVEPRTTMPKPNEADGASNKPRSAVAKSEKEPRRDLQRIASRAATRGTLYTYICQPAPTKIPVHSGRLATQFLPFAAACIYRQKSPFVQVGRRGRLMVAGGPTISDLSTRGRHTGSMRWPALVISTLISLGAGEATAAVSPEGVYKCALSGQGACGEGPEGICLGNRVRRGKPHVFLTLDFDENHASLNGMEGRIIRGQLDRVYWDDLGLLGSPSIQSVFTNGDTTHIVLVAGGSLATFSCHRS